VEASRNQVLPVDDRYLDRPRSRAVGQERRFSYHAGDARIPASAAPNTGAQSWSLTADMEVGAAASGVLTTHGGRFGGWGLFMDKGRVNFVYALPNQERDRTSMVAPRPLAAGWHRIELAFDYDAKPGESAHASLLVDGAMVGTVTVPCTARQGLTIDETFDVGLDTGTPVSETYADAMPNAFQGELRSLTIDVR